MRKYFYLWLCGCAPPKSRIPSRLRGWRGAPRSASIADHDLTYLRARHLRSACCALNCAGPPLRATRTPQVRPLHTAARSLQTATARPPLPADAIPAASCRAIPATAAARLASLAHAWPCPSFAHLSGPSGVYLESTRARELSSSDGSCSSCVGSYSLQVPPATAVPGVSRSRAAILRRARVQQLAEGRIVRPAEQHLRDAGLQPGQLGPQPDHTRFGT